MVLESAWIWFSKTRTRGKRIVFFLPTRSILWPKTCRKCDGGRGSALDPAGGAHDTPPDHLVGYWCLYMLIKVPVWVNLVLRIYPSYSPWKVLEFDFDKWARTMYVQLNWFNLYRRVIAYDCIADNLTHVVHIAVLLRYCNVHYIAHSIY